MGDPTTYPDGSAMDGQPRFTDSDVDQAINDVLIEMQLHMTGQRPGESLKSVDITYSGDSTDLPSAIGYESVYRVESLADTNFPVGIPYATPQEMTNHPGDGAFQLGRRVYTLIASDTAPGFQAIQVRPKQDSGLTIRVWYIATPLVFSAEDGSLTSDAHPLSPRWREYIELSVAIRLLRRDNEVSEQQAGDWARLHQLFLAFSNRNRGRERIPRRRKGIS
jgi:hypothetical protein